MFRNHCSYEILRIAEPSVRVLKSSSDQANNSSNELESSLKRGVKSYSTLILAKRFHGQTS